MNSDQDQARLIAARVARKFAEPANRERPKSRDSTLDLESEPGSGEPRRAKIIDFIASGPPVRIASQTSVSYPPPRTLEENKLREDRDFAPATQSPWLASWSSMFGQTPQRVESSNPQSAIPNPQFVAHPSQEKFGVDEAALNELVEFFENEKKCSVDPSGKPCDHCAMCSTRGF